MVADLLEHEANLKFSTKIKDNGQSNREILFGYLGNHFYENLGINIIFGQKVDKIFDDIFLPLQLMESISMTKNSQLNKLSNDTKTLNKQQITTSFSVFNNVFTLLLVLSVIIFVPKTWLTNSYLIVMAVIGTFLFLVGFYSFHEEVSANYNIILFNPLLILLVVMQNKLVRKTILFILIASLTIYTFYMLNKPFLLLILPFIVTNYVIFYRLLKKQYQSVR